MRLFRFRQVVWHGGAVACAYVSCCRSGLLRFDFRFAAVELLDQFLNEVTLMRRQRLDLRREFDRLGRRRIALVARQRLRRRVLDHARRRAVVQPVQFHAQPAGERFEFVRRRNRAARQPFVRGLRRNRLRTAVTQIEPVRQFRRTVIFSGLRRKANFRRSENAAFSSGVGMGVIVQFRRRVSDNRIS